MNISEPTFSVEKSAGELVDAIYFYFGGSVRVRVGSKSDLSALIRTLEKVEAEIKDTYPNHNDL